MNYEYVIEIINKYKLSRIILSFDNKVKMDRKYPEYYHKVGWHTKYKNEQCGIYKYPFDENKLPMIERFLEFQSINDLVRYLNLRAFW